MLNKNKIILSTLFVLVFFIAGNVVLASDLENYKGIHEIDSENNKNIQVAESRSSEKIIPISKFVEDIFNLLFSIDKRKLFKIGKVKLRPIIFSVIFRACFKFSWRQIICIIIIIFYLYIFISIIRLLKIEEKSIFWVIN